MSLLRVTRFSNSLSPALIARHLCSAPPPPTPAQAQAEFWRKNEKLQRPLSPWIIYKFQLTSMLSITHRGTGLGLGVLIYGMGVNSLIAGNTNWARSLEWVANTFPVWTLTSLKVLVATAVGYHLFNGIRHLMWDYGIGFQLKQLYTSGYFVIALTLVIGIVAALNA
jgi:succinate dehydrogenase (ubiquinone) cytochrome b560 subunit